MTRTIMPRHSHVGLLLLGPLLLAGCASGGGATYDAGTLPPMEAETTRIAEANRRILTANPGGPADSSEVSNEFPIGAGDQIRIDVFGVETFDGTFRVEESGDIALPLVGSIQAANLTTRELEVAIGERLRETYMRNPHVTVQIAEVGSRAVSVIGSVNEPGVYQIMGRSSLLDVLAMAQGLTETAGNSVFVVRPARAQGMREASETLQFDAAATSLGAPGSEVMEVDLGALLTYGRTSENLVVLPGDIVQVRPAGLVYVAGQVNQPGGFQIPTGPPLDVLQALAMAEGLGRTAAADRAVIVRQAEDGSRQEIPIHLDKMLDGEVAPPALMPRDVLFVPNNRNKAWRLGVLGAVVSMFTFRGLFY
ncbi:MAG: polysaccharide biosynthesis/export family protein [Gemmatimonadota bacterium]